MNTRKLLGTLATVALLIVFLRVYNNYMLHGHKIITNEDSKYIKSNQGVAVSLRMRSEERLRHFRATRWQTDKAFHRYLTSPDVSCSESYRAGNKHDGGWDVCVSGPFLPKAPCLVYSFGIAYDFSFDDAVAKQFDCNVLSFDPSMAKAENHKRGKNIDFIKEGISGEDFKDKHGWNLFSFNTILKKQNHQNTTIDYFKMDVEWSEWQVIPDMAAKGLFKNIKQIGLEIHRHIGKTECVRLINILEDNGFRKWKMDYNMACGYKMKDGTKTSQCLELYFINMNFIDDISLGSFVSMTSIKDN